MHCWLCCDSSGCVGCTNSSISSIILSRPENPTTRPTTLQPSPGPSLQPSSNPTQAPIFFVNTSFYTLFQILSTHSFGDVKSLSTNGTSQQRAFDWLVKQYSVVPFGWNCTYHFIQNYALATHYYSTSRSQWINNSGWLNADHQYFFQLVWYHLRQSKQYQSLKPW